MATALSKPGTIFVIGEGNVSRHETRTHYIRERGGWANEVVERWLHKTQIPIKLLDSNL